MMNPDFKELFQLFNANHVEYLIVGGYTVIEYTEPRRAAGRPQDLQDVASLERGRGDRSK